VVSFTPLPLYSWGHSPQYSLHRRLGGPQSRSGCHGEEKNLLPLPGIEPQFLCRPAHSVVTIPTELSRLPNLKQRFCGMMFLQSFYHMNHSAIIPPHLIFISIYILYGFLLNIKLRRMTCTLNTVFILCCLLILLCKGI
jgi:hypothetical protein